MPISFPAIWLLAGIRFAALFVVAPFFGNRVLPRVALIPVAGVLGVFGAMLAPLQVTGAHADLSIGFREVLFEVCVGLGLGLASRLLFSVFEVFGELAAWAVMPVGGNSSPLLGGQRLPTVFVSLLGTCFFFLVGGHHALIGAFVSTLGCVSLGGLGSPPVLTLGLADQFTAVFSVVLTWSVLLVLPLFFVAVAVELIGGIVVNFGQVVLRPTIPVFRVLATEVVLVALWYTIVRVAIEYLLVFVEEHPVCQMLVSN